MFIQDPDDKRKAVRMDFLAEATVTTSSDNRILHGQMKNLSIHGMLIEGEAEIEVGETCTATITIPDRHSYLAIGNLATEVVRSAPGEIGLKFLQPFEWLALFHIYQSKSGGR